MSAGELLEFTRMSGAVVKAMRDCAAADRRGRERRRGRRRLGARAGLRPPAARPLGEALVPLHARRPGRCGHGRRVPAARGSSGSAARPSCSSSETRSTPTGRSRSASRRASSTTTSCRPRRTSSRGGSPTVPRSPTRRRRCCSAARATWPSADAIEMEALAQALLMKSEDFAEFYAAWSEGRSPAWTRPVIVNPPELPEPVGFAHAVVAGGAVYLGGQTGEGASLVEQFDSAADEARHGAARGRRRARPARLARRLHDGRRGVPRVDRASSARSGGGTSGGATRRWR